ncbi:hypothetical protein BC937DRAFT_94556 [Endogone sp. FLAS-F59071]|nr:hypothetical protein BC937DRAFT_94556 [Endogone sp. FLAS-F59071]|eukprot:RUS20706.1 hypothetical protein BC937DRAFT_94556 [Endogone sp. FLAS-F59071]
MASHKKQPAATRPNQPQRQQASSKPVKQTLEDPLQMTLSFDNGPQLASPRVSDFTEKQRNPEGTSKSGLDNPFEEWGHKYIIGGVEMRFPFKPYPSQIQMMAKIIQALQRSQNAILESPTGSGKSLALLCAVLAWREYEKQRLISEWQQKLTEKKQKHQQQQQEQEQAVAVDSGAPDLHETLDDVDESLPLPPRFHDIDDDDFQPLPKSRKPAADAGVGMSRKPGANVEGKENVRPGNVELGSKREKGAVITVDELALEKTGKLKLPKIYFGSRTHKQISQIVKELKTNTIYRPRMAILGSRNHMCIHPEVSTSSNKNERCTEMLDEDSCSYFHNVRPLRSHKSLQPNGYNAIWDIEDLVKLGKKQKGCPYFTSRALAETADIVFCPYNYLVDPLVREAMDINLEDSIIILDEAHNIEDAAREASSFEVTEADLRNLEKELENKIALDILLEQYRVILHIINTFLIWISNPESTYSMKEYERYVNLWSGQQLVAKLDAAGINPSTYKTTLKPALDKLLAVAAEEIRQRVEDRNGASDRERQLVTINYDHGEEEPLTSGKSLSISTKALKILEGVFMVFGYIFQEDRTFIDDYKMALIKKIQRKKFGQQDLPAESEWIYQLGFWCLNPGVTFHAISSMARSIILTSGTLSPMESFASELQADFPIRLEANHVINSSQVWAGVIPVGPAGTEFSGTFKNMEVLKYQDDLGGALLRLVEAVPFGVLCFMPSYSAMEKFVRRWKATGLYKQISKKKFVIEESQSTAKSDFEKELGKFYGYVQKAKNGSSGEKDGALFFAVYRGKVSEGIDFTDDNCRAVIAIGIPYPHVNDIQVKLKREYNENKCSKGKKVLSGSAWYDIQAFRAINQALGRCIRHRKDWGMCSMFRARCTINSHFGLSNNTLVF